MSDDLQAYYKSLDAALIAFIRDENMEPMKLHVMEWGQGDIISKTLSELECVKWGLFKAATARKTLPMDVRQKAKRLLLENGFQSWDDGDVETPGASDL